MTKIVVNGKAIKWRLIELDMSGRELAQQINRHEQTITNVINGGSWSHQIVAEIADALGVDPLELLVTTVKEGDPAQ